MEKPIIKHLLTLSTEFSTGGKCAAVYALYKLRCCDKAENEFAFLTHLTGKVVKSWLRGPGRRKKGDKAHRNVVYCLLIIKHSRLRRLLRYNGGHYGKICPRTANRRPTVPSVPIPWYGGKNAVTELLKSGGAVDTVYLTDAMPSGGGGLLYGPVQGERRGWSSVCPQTSCRRCAARRDQGVAARAAEVAYASLDDLFEGGAGQGRAALPRPLRWVEDPHNLGAIVRSAYLCKFTVLSSPSAAVSV